MKPILKSYDLVWLEHLGGDIHQPLHGATRYYQGKGDEGGNFVKISLTPAMRKQFEGSLGTSAPSELHAFWDDLPGEGAPAPVTPVAVTFAKMLSPAAKTAVADTDPAHWAAESLASQGRRHKMPPLGAGLTPKNASSYAIPQDYFSRDEGCERSRRAGRGALPSPSENLR
jgi:hypothetical protein